MRSFVGLGDLLLHKIFHVAIPRTRLGSKPCSYLGESLDELRLYLGVEQNLTDAHCNHLRFRLNGA
jgi:hypothetical protein